MSIKPIWKKLKYIVDWKKLKYIVDSALVITTTLSAIALVLMVFFMIITVIKSLFG